MELQAYVLFATVLAINNVLLCCGAENTKLDSSKFEINTSKVTRNGKCARKIDIKGNGVSDTIIAECVDHSVTILREDGALVYGRPHDDTFFLFTEAPSSLIVVDNGKCTMKMYSPTKKRRTMSDKECFEVQNKIEDLYLGPDTESSSLTFLSSGSGNGVAESSQGLQTEEHKPEEPKPAEPIPEEHEPEEPKPEEPSENHSSESHQSVVSSPSSTTSGNMKFDPANFDIDAKTATMNTKCVRSITIKGNGVSDSFKVGCSTQDQSIARQDGAMAYGKPPKDTFYMFSDALSTLITIEDGKCTKRTYSADYKVTNTLLSNADCSKIQKKIEDLASGKSLQSYSLLGDIWDLIVNIFKNIFMFPKA